jgi:DNA-binding response OmpR family regulator
MRTLGVRVLLLGNAAVVDRECTHAIGSPRQATVLAALATRAGTTVSAEALIEDVWGAEAPSTARNTLQVHVSGL